MTDKPVILIVDDQPQNIELLEAHLAPQGYEIVMAANGVEALAKLSSDPIDLILLDVMMPGIDGFEVTRRVRQDNTHRLLPIILVTALRETEDRVKGIEAGCDDFISKPVDKSELLARVRSLLKVKAYNDLMNNYRKELEAEVTRRTEELNSALERMKLASLETIYRLSVASEFKDVDTCAHIKRMSSYAAAGVPGMGPDQRTFETIFHEAPTHDSGKIGIPEAALPKRAGPDLVQRIILLAIEGITERMEAEDGMQKAHEQLKRLNIELKHSSRVKSEFLANMSHELRTPLNSIIGFSEVLCDQTFGPLNEKQKKYVNNVLASGKHLLSLINQILDTAQIESGKMALTLSNISMKSLLKGMAVQVENLASKKKLQMVFEIPEDLPDINADELKVNEILYNLLSNAIKYTPEGSKIGMRARKADSAIEIVVWDTGVGIAPENIGKIFEEFFRTDTPYSSVTEGTGLGLPLARKLVEMHGGKLTVESDGLNKGTSVRFTLPIISARMVING